jgi:hypothetical protein
MSVSFGFCVGRGRVGREMYAFATRRRVHHIPLVCANDELAEELVAETVKVITVELGRLLALEVGFCESYISDPSKTRIDIETYHIC